jgi:inner membrane protein
MKGHTHMLFAMLIGGIYFNYFGGGSLLLKLGFAGCLILGALLPDIDEVNSTISHKAPTISKFVQGLTNHRGIMHSIWVPIALFLILTFLLGRIISIPNLLVMGLVVGYSSHLLSDCLTVQGIKPFHPLHKFQIRGFIRTGGLLELILVGLIIVYFIVK